MRLIAYFSKYRKVSGLLMCLLSYLCLTGTAVADTSPHIPLSTFINNTIRVQYTDVVGIILAETEDQANTVVVQWAIAGVKSESTGQPITYGDTIYYPIIITNLGNGPDSFSFTATNRMAVFGVTTTFIEDSDSDGIHDPGENKMVTQTPVLRYGTTTVHAGTYTIFAAVFVPKTGMPDYDTVLIRVISSYNNSESVTLVDTTLQPAINRYVISAIQPETAGVPFTLNLTALDATDTPIPYASANVNLLISAGTLTPATSSLSFNTSGTTTLTVSVTKTGLLTLTVTDGTASGTSNIYVIHNVRTQFLVSVDNLFQTAGQGFIISITAADAYGNADTDFMDTMSISALQVGTVPITPSVSGIFNNGVDTELLTLTRSGTTVILLTDSTAISESITIYINPAGIDHFIVSGPLSVVAGADFILSITAEDTFANVEYRFSDTVAFTEDGIGAISPAQNDTPFVSGILKQTVSITLGSYNVTITVSDGANHTGTHTLDVIGVPALSISAGIMQYHAKNDTVYYPHTITNLGTGIDTFTFNISSQNGLRTWVLLDANANSQYDTTDTTVLLNSGMLLPLGDSISILLGVWLPDTLPPLSVEKTTLTAVSGIDTGVSASAMNTTITANDTVPEEAQINVTPVADPANNRLVITIQLAGPDGVPVAPPLLPANFVALSNSDTAVSETQAVFGKVHVYYYPLPKEGKIVEIAGTIGTDSFGRVFAKRRQTTFVIPALDQVQVMVPEGVLGLTEYIGIRNPKDEMLSKSDAAFNALNNSVIMRQIKFTGYDPTHDITTTKPVPKFDTSVMVIIPYFNADKDEFVDGTDIIIETLKMYTLPDNQVYWQLVKGSTLMKADNYVYAYISQLDGQLFTIMGSRASNNLSRTNSYPNPFYLSNPNFNSGRQEIDIMTFTPNLKYMKVRIYNSAGRLARILDEGAEIDLANGLAVWDGRNEYGQKVASGLYIYMVETDKGKGTGKITIIK